MTTEEYGANVNAKENEEDKQHMYVRAYHKLRDTRDAIAEVINDMRAARVNLHKLLERPTPKANATVRNMAQDAERASTANTDALHKLDKTAALLRDATEAARMVAIRRAEIDNRVQQVRKEYGEELDCTYAALTQMRAEVYDLGRKLDTTRLHRALLAVFLVATWIAAVAALATV